MLGLAATALTKKASAGGGDSGKMSSQGADIVVVQGKDYAANTTKAVDCFGGMKRFVAKGAKVALLPNTQSRHPGTFTKPEIVGAVIKLCYQAGAGQVSCLSWLKRRSWEATGIAEVIEKEGAQLKLIGTDETSFKTIPVPAGRRLKKTAVMNELFNHDVIIDIPITKDHAGNRFTGSMKNLMGINSPGINLTFHTGKDKEPDDIEHLDQCIADLNTAVTPALCIVDATEFIITNGPFGPGQILKPGKVVVGVDRVAVDSYCARLWELNPHEIIMIRRAFEHGLGQMDLSKVSIREIKI
jgi:uncharacterized protein (DUF362 family)